MNARIVITHQNVDRSGIDMTYLKASFLTVLGENALVWRVNTDADETYNVIIRQITQLTPTSSTTSTTSFHNISQART